MFAYSLRVISISELLTNMFAEASKVIAVAFITLRTVPSVSPDTVVPTFS